LDETTFYNINMTFRTVEFVLGQVSQIESKSIESFEDEMQPLGVIMTLMEDTHKRNIHQI